MSIDRLGKLQERLVSAVVNELKGKWDIAVVNIEIEELEGDVARDHISFSLVRQKSSWKRTQFYISIECSRLFGVLRDLDKSDKWSACTLEVASDGRYEFSYSYDPPPRLNGIFSDESMLKGHVPNLLP
jgi:hypothetical protein